MRTLTVLLMPQGVIGRILSKKDVHERYLLLFKSGKFDNIPEDIATKRPHQAYYTHTYFCRMSMILSDVGYWLFILVYRFFQSLKSGISVVQAAHVFLIYMY